ncbi:MAG: CopG family transcriptional regulator [Candidatus Dormiibacterota bacterium]
MSVRTQVYLSEEQRARLAERGRRQGVAIALLVREAVDLLLAEDDGLETTFGALPEIATLVPSRTEWDGRGRPAG